MAFSRPLLLIIIYLLSSNMPSGVQPRPIDLVCDDRVRRDRLSLDDLETDMNNCDGSELLPSPVLLPCVRIQKAAWDRKPLRDKRAEVSGAMGGLLDSVVRSQGHSTLPCQSSLLSKLEQRLRNHQLIIARLEIPEGSAAAASAAASAAAAEPSGADCPHAQTRLSSNLGEVLQRYGALLRGKVERLLSALRPLHSCPD